MTEEPGRSAKREVKRRRRFTEEFRRQVVEETLAGESSIAAVALDDLKRCLGIEALDFFDNCRHWAPTVT